MNLYQREITDVYFIYLLLERGQGREEERERNINVWLPLTHPLLGTWSTTQACALTGNRTGNNLVCRLVLNPLSHTSQGYTFFFYSSFWFTAKLSRRYRHFPCISCPHIRTAFPLSMSHTRALHLLQTMNLH